MQEEKPLEPVIPIIPEKTIEEDNFEMFQDMETLNEEEIQPITNSPFGVAPVDPLVFKKTTDSPELRAAAAYIPISTVPVEREKAPEEPTRQDFDSWTPGLPTSPNTVVAEVQETKTKQEKVKNISPQIKIQNPVRIVFTVLAVVIPLGLLAAAIYFGILLTS